ncbi:transposase [Flavobacterium psychrotrophum]|uniref:transposase n=1 Tax=Flavobacterium psychrotrophum TaxID=2294119 RepID=UPI000E3184ED|nr:transposase [Flavobacterium psychrotrophum]
MISKTPLKQRNKVKEITLDMAANIQLIAKRSFPNTTLVTDRFHVQKLATEALQQIRIKHRWEAIDQESEVIEVAKAEKKRYEPIVLSNGGTVKQLLARGRYSLYKRSEKWTFTQKERAVDKPV